MKLWDRMRGRTDQPSEAEGLEVPVRTRWCLTICRKCKHVSWFGMVIPHLEVSKEPYKQLKRVSHGRKSSKRVTITDHLRIVMSKPDKNKWKCSRCGASVEQCGVATGPAQMLAVTQYAMRHEPRKRMITVMKHAAVGPTELSLSSNQL